MSLTVPPGAEGLLLVRLGACDPRAARTQREAACVASLACKGPCPLSIPCGATVSGSNFLKENSVLPAFRSPWVLPSPHQFRSACCPSPHTCMALPPLLGLPLLRTPPSAACCAWAPASHGVRNDPVHSRSTCQPVSLPAGQCCTSPARSA